MPTVVGHAAFALALGTAFRPAGAPARFWLAGAGCAMLPDVDVLAFSLGLPYGHVLGHRGLTHSLAFAAALAAAVTWACFPEGRARRAVRARLWAYLFLATASHGVLDAMTDGGSGIAFLAPVDGARHFLPWRPIEVSPLGLRPFLEGRATSVLVSEAWWVLLPSALLAAASLAWRRGRGPARTWPA